MKYLSIIIVLAMLIFMTIDGKKKSKKKPKTTKKPPTTISIGPPKWKPWKGKKPLDATLIAENAAALWYDCGHKYFKFVGLNSTETRTINDIHRYRVRYYAKKCQSGKPEKRCTGKGRKKRCFKTGNFKLSKCNGKKELFQTVFKDAIVRNKLRLNVTKLDNKFRSCVIVIKYHQHPH